VPLGLEPSNLPPHDSLPVGGRQLVSGQQCAAAADSESPVYDAWYAAACRSAWYCCGNSSKCHGLRSVAYCRHRCPVAQMDIQEARCKMNQGQCLRPSDDGWRRRYMVQRSYRPTPELQDLHQVWAPVMMRPLNMRAAFFHDPAMLCSGSPSMHIAERQPAALPSPLVNLRLPRKLIACISLKASTVS